MLLGSETTKVLTHTRRPVLVVRWEFLIGSELLVPTDRADGHSRTHLRGRDRARPCRALAFGLQGSSPDGYGRHVPAHDGRAQRRDRLQPGKPRARHLYP